MPHRFQGFMSRCTHKVNELVILECGHGHGLLRSQPAAEAMPGRVTTEERVEPSPWGTVVTIFYALKVGAHVFRFPRRITGKVGDVVPVGVVRIDRNHRIVGSTATQRASTGIEDTFVLV